MSTPQKRWFQWVSLIMLAREISLNYQDKVGRQGAKPQNPFIGLVDASAGLLVESEYQPFPLISPEGQPENVKTEPMTAAGRAIAMACHEPLDKVHIVRKSRTMWTVVIFLCAAPNKVRLHGLSFPRLRSRFWSFFMCRT